MGYLKSFVVQRLGKAIGIVEQPVDDNCSCSDTTVGIFVDMYCNCVDFYSYIGKHAAGFGAVH